MHTGLPGPRRPAPARRGAHTPSRSGDRTSCTQLLGTYPIGYHPTEYWRRPLPTSSTTHEDVTHDIRAERPRGQSGPVGRRPRRIRAAAPRRDRRGCGRRHVGCHPATPAGRVGRDRGRRALGPRLVCQLRPPLLRGRGDRGRGRPPPADPRAPPRTLPPRRPGRQRGGGHRSRRPHRHRALDPRRHGVPHPLRQAGAQPRRALRPSAHPRVRPGAPAPHRGRRPAALRRRRGRTPRRRW